MNKKLEDIRDNSSIIFVEYSEDTLDNIPYRCGFDKAIALDLPVKFTDWLSSEGWQRISFELPFVKWFNNKIHKGDRFKASEIKTSVELFNYWLDNIYTNK